MPSHSDASVMQIRANPLQGFRTAFETACSWRDPSRSQSRESSRHTRRELKQFRTWKLQIRPTSTDCEIAARYSLCSAAETTSTPTMVGPGETPDKSLHKLRRT